MSDRRESPSCRWQVGAAQGKEPQRRGIKRGATIIKHKSFYYSFMSSENEILPAVPATERPTASISEPLATHVPERRKRPRGENEESPHKAFQKILDLDHGHNYLGQVNRHLESLPQDREGVYQGLMLNVGLIQKHIDQTGSPALKEKETRFKEFLIAVANFLKKYPTIMIKDGKMVRGQ